MCLARIDDNHYSRKPTDASMLVEALTFHPPTSTTRLNDMARTDAMYSLYAALTITCC